MEGWSSEMTSLTPRSPRSTRPFRRFLQASFRSPPAGSTVSTKIPVAFFVHPHRHQKGQVHHPPAPVHLEVGRVQVEVGVGQLQRPAPPGGEFLLQALGYPGDRVLTDAHPGHALRDGRYLAGGDPLEVHSSTASSASPVIRLYRSKTSVRKVPSRSRGTRSWAILPAGVMRSRV
jgi:hypothetical protein